MCGRYVAVSSPDVLAEHFEVTETVVDKHRPRFNVAPSTQVYSIIDHGDERRLGTMRWGFVPVWAEKVGGKGQPINARLETVSTSRMFSSAFAQRRCLLPADGFYEWQDRGQGRAKQPYHIADPDGKPLAFAGIWTSWRPAAGEEPIYSTAIITTAASGTMTSIHDRMPLILPANLWDTWLGTELPANDPHLLEVLSALQAPRLTATAITARVNSVRNDDPEILTPGSVDA